MAFTILVVDDELPLREMLRDIFTMAGYNVLTAEDGKVGLEKIEKYLIFAYISNRWSPCVMKVDFSLDAKTRTVKDWVVGL